MAKDPKLILINPFSNPRLFKDELFNPDIEPNLSVYRCLRDNLKKINVALHTFDYGGFENAEALVFLNVPYPWEFKNWQLLLKYSYKSFVFFLEPPLINPFNYLKLFNHFFKKVFVFDKKSADNKKYFMMYFPQSDFMYDLKEIPFKNKKFLSLVNANKDLFVPFKLLAPISKDLYSERKRAISFFEKVTPHDFDLFGRGWDAQKWPSFRGEVSKKIETLAQYKFSICFENCVTPGYVSEKIFDCFKAKCIPIYYGAPDITDYIPDSCFVDFRKFSSYQNLLDYLNTMDEKTYTTYIKNIKDFLYSSDVKHKWFEQGWSEFFIESVL